MKQVFKGDIAYSKNKEELSVHPDSFIIVSDGIVEGIYPVVPEEYKNLPLVDYTGKLIIPAFSDLHLHASQYYQRGVGMDKLLLDWLDTYTFPQESDFVDMEYAQGAYDRFTRDLIRHGTLHAAIYTTVHYDASDYLFRLWDSLGLYGYIGKLNMDQNCPDSLKEDRSTSIQETERFILEHGGSPTVKPIVTPRFAISCTEELIAGLGKLVRKYHVPVQTHLCESREEVAAVKELFPAYSYDAEIYEKYGLIGNSLAIMAHCIYLQDDDIRAMNRNDAIAVHCPDSNINVTAGLMPARELSDGGMRIALGSDIGGGHDIPIYRAAARAIQVSKLRSLLYAGEEKIGLPEAFHFATRAGGECFGTMGAFEPGYHFNALVIDDDDLQGLDVGIPERIERFCYIGDDHNIASRYVNGRLLEIPEVPIAPRRSLQ